MIMKAKKLLSIILVGVSAVSILAGCSSGTSSQDSSAEETAGSTQEESSEETAQSDDQEEIEKQRERVAKLKDAVKSSNASYDALQ